MNRLSITLCSLAALPLLSGCVLAAVGVAGTAAVSANQERTFGEAVDDVAIETEVKSKLISHGSLGEVDVEVAGGLVLISGRVQTPELRVTAESIAWSAKRTRDVANEVRIESPGGFFSNASDEIISARVRARLIGSKSVKSVNINVETYGGVVYLTGIARDAHEIERAAEEASYAGGVNQVVSYLRLRDERGEIVPYQPATPAPYDPDELVGDPES